jgi:FkbM family methyltransferase
MRFSVSHPLSSLFAFLARKAKSFHRWHNGFSYDFDKNGEATVLSKLSLAGLVKGNVFDVGANVGDWSKTAAGFFPNARFHCFELSPATFQTLQANLEDGRFVLNNMGLSDKRQEIEFRDFGKNSEVNTLLVGMDYHKHIPFTLTKAQVETGAAYCEANGVSSIDFLKIDVEGAESLVLKGFAPMLEAGQIRCIQFEYGYANGDAHFLMKDFYQFFESYGYKIGKISRKKVLFSDFFYQLNDFDSGPNFMAVGKVVQELIEILGSEAP